MDTDCDACEEERSQGLDAGGRHVVVVDEAMGGGQVVRDGEHVKTVFTYGLIAEPGPPRVTEVRDGESSNRFAGQQAGVRENQYRCGNA